MIRSAASGLVLLAASAAAAGENVVLIQPSQVSVPAALPGDCRIDGLVREVWAGSAFHVGQAVSITAPCSDGKAKLERKPAKPHRPATLKIWIEKSGKNRRERLSATPE